MARKLYGERLYDRYIKHPAASSTNPLSDGWALDAATVMMMASNINHLASQSHRILVQSTGTGTTTFSSFTTKAEQWTRASYEPGDTATLTGPGAIPWDRRTAVRFGPVPITFDRLSSGQRVARTVRLRVQLKFTTVPDSRTLHFALTSGYGPRLPRLSPLAWTSTDADNSTSLQAKTADLSIVSPLVEQLSEPWPCRGTGSVAYGDMLSYLVPMYVWFGWDFYGGPPVGYFLSFCAWELKPGA